ncbi:MAG TPA: metal-dependent transcriptional regulator [bacterium]|jgi:DtxR family Mn-dependent transcriptional regulator
MPSINVEDYIKTIWSIESEHERATTKRIAQQLNVKMASVTGMIKYLSSEGYVAHVPYKGVTLTEKGHKVAMDMLRRHRIIELFLSKALDMSWDELHDEAENLEHAVSDRLVERMYEHLGRPEFDPHGHRIPDNNGVLSQPESIPLAHLEIGTEAKILEVPDTDPEFLRYLTGLKIQIGSTIKILEKSPFEGPIKILIGKNNSAISVETARRIKVTA